MFFYFFPQKYDTFSSKKYESNKETVVCTSNVTYAFSFVHQSYQIIIAHSLDRIYAWRLNNISSKRYNIQNITTKHILSMDSPQRKKMSDTRMSERCDFKNTRVYY